MNSKLKINKDNFYSVSEEICNIMDSTTVSSVTPLQLSVFHYYIEEKMVESLAPILEGKSITRAKWRVLTKLGIKEFIEFTGAYKRVAMTATYLAQRSEELGREYTVIPCRVVGNTQEGIDGHAVSFDNEDFYMVYTPKSPILVLNRDSLFNKKHRENLQRAWSERGAIKEDMVEFSLYDFNIIKFNKKELELTEEYHTDSEGIQCLIREVKVGESKCIINQK